MFKCYGCDKSFNKGNDLQYHQRFICRETIAFPNKYVCPDDDCIRHFSNISSLRQHIRKHHNPPQSPISVDNPSTSQFIPSASTELLPVVASENSNQSLTTITTSSDDIIQKRMTQFISKLHSHTMIPRSVVQFIIDNLDDFFSKDVIVAIKDKILSSLPSGLNPSELRNRPETFSLDLFCGLRTEHHRLKYFQSLGSFVRPEEIVLGGRHEYRNVNGVYSLLNVDCTMQIVPLREILGKFLCLGSTLHGVLTYVSSLNNESTSDEPIKNVMGGSVWKKIVKDYKCNNNHDLLLPIIIYTDDFEVGNPLGSHAGIHKLGAVYISLPFLPSSYVSQIKHIFLLALFHSSDRLKFGNNVIFQKVIEELNYLRNEGIPVNCKDFTGRIKFLVCSMTGDNLGLNSTLGFVENFTANRCCRICNARRKEMQTLYCEDQGLLRDMETYESQLLLNDVSQSGIKEKCVWLSLDGFDMFNHVSTDILHDWFEGCCVYTMSFILKALVDDVNVIHLDTLIDKIVAFDYGPDSDSKPSNCIQKVRNSFKLKTSGSEMLVLVRYFGLILGDYVPADNDIWLLYIQLRRITDRLLNRNVYADTVEQFKVQIEEFNELYCNLTKETLKPKFHFLTHYPQMMLKFGPLSLVWTMRFEARHRLSKYTASLSCNRKNICKTIALKNQLILNDLLLDNSVPRTFTSGLGKEVRISTVKEITSQLNIDSSNISFREVKWLKINGNCIRLKTNLTFDICEVTLLPIFVDVENIVTFGESGIALLCAFYDTLDFNEHFFAYQIRRTDRVRWLRFEAIMRHVPNNITIMSNMDIYVTLRCPID